MTIVELLKLIQQIEAQLMFVALVIYFFRFKALDSYLTTVILILILSGTHIAAEPYIQDLAVEDDYRYYWEAILVWHGFFAFTDFIVIFSIFGLNKYFKFPVTKFMFFTAQTYLLFSIVQILRYADRAVFKTDQLAGFYQHAIPTLNTALTLIVIASCLQAIYSDLKLKGSISK